MGRRASSSLNATAIVGIVVVLLVLVGGAAMFVMKSKKGAGFSSPKLAMEDVLDNANSLRGNVYQVEGKVTRREVRDSGEGVSLLVESGGGEPEHLFIVIPNDLEHENIERDQTYAFEVEFGEGGVAVATGVKRL